MRSEPLDRLIGTRRPRTDDHSSGHTGDASGNRRTTIMILSTRTRTLWSVISVLPVLAFILWDGPTWLTLVLMIIAPLLMAIPHEGLHVLGHRLYGVRARLGQIKSVFGWPTLAVQALEPQSLRSYRLALLLPALVLGLVPLVLGVSLGSRPVLLIGWVGVSMASSDLAVWFHLRHWPGQTLVRDHPGEVGVIRLDA